MNQKPPNNELKELKFKLDNFKFGGYAQKNNYEDADGIKERNEMNHFLIV